MVQQKCKGNEKRDQHLVSKWIFFPIIQRYEQITGWSIFPKLG